MYFDNLLIVHRQISSQVSAVFYVYSLWLVLRVLKEELWHASGDLWTVPDVLLRITSPREGPGAPLKLLSFSNRIWTFVDFQPSSYAQDEPVLPLCNQQGPRSTKNPLILDSSHFIGITLGALGWKQ